MCPLRRVSCVLFLLSLTYFSHGEERNTDKDIITVDHCNDMKGPNFNFPTEWNIVCFDDIKTLRENVTSDWHNDIILQNFTWPAFENVSGIWAFFNQDPPPAFGLPPPAITCSFNNRLAESVSLTYFMYGNNSKDNITISSKTHYVPHIIASGCGTRCTEFVETGQLPLGDDGAYTFEISLNTFPGSSFVLIDKIVIVESDVPSRPPSQPTKSDSNESLTDPPTSTPMDSGDGSNTSDPNGSSLNSNIYSLFGMSLSTMIAGVLIFISQFGNILL